MLGPSIDNQLREALEKADLPALKQIFVSNLINVENKYQTLTIKGNLLHVFCYETNPGRSQMFYHEPPYYTKMPLEHKFSSEICKEIIDFLVSQGVTLDDKDTFFKQPPLNTAIGFDNTPAALALIQTIQEQQRPELLNATISGTFTSNPILLAIQKGNKPVFDALLKTGKIDINKPDSFGLTPLHWATIMCEPEMIEDLINVGANIQAVANNGKKPRDYITITPEQFEPITRWVQGHPILVENTTKEKEFRPIVAHFNNNTEKFLTVRNERFQLAREKLLTVLLETTPVVSLAKEEFEDEKSEKDIEKLKATFLFSSRSQEEDDLRRAMTFSEQGALERQKAQELREKQKADISYHANDDTPNYDHLMQHAALIMQTPLQLTPEEENFIKMHDKEENTNHEKIYLPKHIQRMVEEYHYPEVIARILVRRISDGNFELSAEDREVILNAHLNNKKGIKPF